MKRVPANPMTELLTAAQMRAIEEAAIASGQVTGLELMERAGRGVVVAIFEEWPELAPSWGPAPKPPELIGQDDQAGHRAVVLCGPGNNGGDGFVVARLLKECGWDVDVFLYGDAERLPPDAKVNYERWREMGEVKLLGFPIAAEEQCDSFGALASTSHDLKGGECFEDAPPFLLIDALFGIGLARPIKGLYDVCAHWDYLTEWPDLNRRHIVSVDIPSGLDADSGQPLWSEGSDFNPFPVLNAELTVTFHKMKLGHVLGQGPLSCGGIRMVDIGL